ncbi:hypothetical protein CBR_g13070 [Chara braunii]|uniref:Uncharacterized protein n=1 Tax=Chara braunii TaxID=69332 RepID=A0A388KTF6_CHABU|nr:hypothetical protein CBR_g13070 [Chara braunii]|eukprot:GBG73350.1 hypothetical protein CBR_g13070 [Chara braunii]
MVSPKGHHSTGHLPLDVAVHVAEIAEVAWEAYQARAEHSTSAAAREEKCVESESALERERLENRRLQATLEEYKTALQQLQRRPGSPEWLGRSLSTPEGTADVYRRLQEKVESPEFLETLARPPEIPTDSPAETSITAKDVANPSWWTWVTENDMHGGEPTEEQDGLGGENYVLIEADDVVDGIANFIARYLQSLPQTKGGWEGCF